MRTYIILLLLLLTAAACNSDGNSKTVKEDNTAATFDLSAAQAMIEQQTQRFTQAHIEKDTAYLNNIFTSDARVLAPNAEMVTGKDAIAKLNYDWVNYGIYEFNETSTSFYGNDEYLIDEGTYYLHYGAENTIDKGKYINIWKNTNGQWKLFSNIWNSNLP